MVGKDSKKKLKHGLGWIPDLPDQRDLPYKLVRKAYREALPTSVDLRSFCSPIEDQGRIGSCVAQSLVGALEFLERKGESTFEKETDLSRLFLYYNARALMGSQYVKIDSGAFIRDGIKSLATDGVCAERIWKYRVLQFKTKPPLTCYTRASHHKISTYHRIDTIDDMKHCLASGYPFVFGFTVYDSFYSDAIARTGTVHMPKYGEKTLGGHAVMAVGYNDGAKRFLVRNSWGTTWGSNGYFTMPYAYLENRDLSADFWAVRR